MKLTLDELVTLSLLLSMMEDDKELNSSWNSSELLKSIEDLNKKIIDEINARKLKINSGAI